MIGYVPRRGTLVCIALIANLALLLLLMSLPAGGQSPPVPPPDSWRNAPTNVVLTFKSRNGSAGVLRSPSLSYRGWPRQATSGPSSQCQPPTSTFMRPACLGSVRLDPSGRLFDMARCINVWPPRDRAPEPKILEQAFAQAVAKSGAYAFPAVRVIARDGDITLQPGQIPSRLVANKYDMRGDGSYVITP